MLKIVYMQIVVSRNYLNMQKKSVNLATIYQIHNIGLYRRVTI